MYIYHCLLVRLSAAVRDVSQSLSQYDYLLVIGLWRLLLQLLLKKKAAAVIQAQGGIRKEDVNSTRKSLSSRQKESLKQRLNDSVGDSADGES